MINENIDFDKNLVLQQIFNTINIIPENWKKIGEVYRNELKQPVFICLNCLDKADNINSVFKTSDGSTFWCHIQQQHNHEKFETLDQISKEIQNFETNSSELKVLNQEKTPNNSEPDDRNTNKTVSIYNIY